jgi:flagellar hook protein FlgE
MLRSMNAAIAGLRNHQLLMDVIGNNIANVNTTAFKGSRVSFQTMLAQTLRTASAPGGGRGGVNPAQIGLGSALASVDVVHTQGALATTNKLTDLAIQGDGFFVLTDGQRRFYTRDGSFDVGADGTLLSPATGLRVMGWSATTDAAGNTVINNTVAPSGSITLPLGQSVAAKATATAGFTGNLNGAATNQVGSGVVESLTTDGAVGFDIAGTDTITFTYNGQTYTTGALSAATKDTTTLATVAADIQSKMNAALTAAGVTADITVTVADDPGSMTGEATLIFSGSKALQFGNTASSNASLNTALKNRAMSGLESFTATLSVYDSLGNRHDVSVRFDKSLTDETGTAADNTWKWSVINLDPGTTIDSAAGNGEGTGFIQFDSAGRFQSVNTVRGTGAPYTVDKPSQASVRLNFANGAGSAQDVVLDFSQLTQFRASSTAAMASNDGYASGTLVSFVVGQDGVITGAYSNGQNRALGQVALATFANPGGLNQVSENLLVDSANSGEATIGVPGAGGRGVINAGQLEMSNVDLAQQFTDMIRAERGFQANSRIITTSDEMLQDLVNMKR